MPRRRTKKTRLIYCEGASDKAFLDCLKSLYATNTYNVDIKRGTGGDQVHLVEEAIRKGRAYDEKSIKIDGDRDAAEMANAEQLAAEQKLVILKTVPCIERLLINILEPTKRIASWSSPRLKNHFESKYVPPHNRTNARTYQILFTRPVLDEAKNRLPELKELIDLF
jgi:hypothetical protein